MPFLHPKSVTNTIRFKRITLATIVQVSSVVQVVHVVHVKGRNNSVMENNPKRNPLGWTTEIVDGKEIRVFRIPPGSKLRIQLPDGSAEEITAPPEGLAFVAKTDFDEIEAVNNALKGESN